MLKSNSASDGYRDNPYCAVTDEQGEVIIRNFPQGDHWIFAASDLWTNNDGQQFNAIAGQLTTTTVRLDRRQLKWDKSN